ncbi:MAG TPA: phosphatase PAP2 family protein [Chloroflexota bacterium]|nr:phosphatase PAP2 family protein [Chloroflexota bacterium]
MKLDYQIEQWINGPAGTHPALDKVMYAAAAWGEPLFIALVVLWFGVGWLAGRPLERTNALAALLASGGALLVNLVVSLIWVRPRPFVSHPGTVHVLLRHTADASFPSDHAAAAFAIAIVLLAEHRRLGALIMAAAVLLSYGRVYVGDHYPTDVLAGAAIGLLVGLLLLTWLQPLALLLRRLGDRLLALLHIPSFDAH